MPMRATGIQKHIWPIAIVSVHSALVSQWAQALSYNSSGTRSPDGFGVRTASTSSRATRSASVK